MYNSSYCQSHPRMWAQNSFFFFFWRGSGWWTKVGKWGYNPTIDFHAYLIPKGNWTLIWSWAWPVEMLDLEWGNLKKICWEEGEEHVGSSFLAPHSQHLQLGSREGKCLQVWGNSSLWFWFAVPWWLLTFGSVFCTCWLFICLLW